ncbi:hypothetical protein [Leucothrix mucor]|uniref:hypothetical protein n=1 Tax=Leucothrix mucor TaxID=45248 RepID=UPI0003B3BCE6|nr:hypothetical protein [Leucothrix mucor]
MKKILIDIELSVRYSGCYTFDKPMINKFWASYLVYYETMVLLMAKSNTLPESLITIEEYPIVEIVAHSVTDLPVDDPLEIKLCSISYCIENEIIYCAQEFDSINERKTLINETGRHIPESISFLKKSFLTLDTIQFILFNQTPVEGKLSESLVKAITDYKKSDHISTLREGIEKIIEENKGNYYLTEDIKRNIQSKLVENQTKILDMLDFDKITTFDLKSLVSDGASIVAGLLTPFLPLSTIQEIYTQFKNKKTISNNSDILFTLSVMYIQKAIAQNSSYEAKSQCGICKLTSVEIDNINDNDVDDFTFKSMEQICFKHLESYLELRKFHGLMGKPLLRRLIES